VGNGDRDDRVIAQQRRRPPGRLLARAGRQQRADEWPKTPPAMTSRPPIFSATSIREPISATSSPVAFPPITDTGIGA
jgi:hypothetical protein